MRIAKAHQADGENASAPRRAFDTRFQWRKAQGTFLLESGRGQLN